MKQGEGLFFCSLLRCREKRFPVAGVLPGSRLIHLYGRSGRRSGPARWPLRPSKGRYLPDAAVGEEGEGGAVEVGTAVWEDHGTLQTQTFFRHALPSRFSLSRHQGRNQVLRWSVSMRWTVGRLK